MRLPRGGRNIFIMEEVDYMNFLMRFPSGKKKAVTLSYDDAHIQDVRLREICDKNGLKCTFNINTGQFAKEGAEAEQGGSIRRMTYNEAYNLFHNSGHEVAVHTYEHKHIKCLPTNLITREILKDRENIEKMFGTIARGMAYPYGSYNDTVFECMKACGIAYSRTTNATYGFDLPDNWYMLNPTCHHNDSRLMELTRNFKDMKLREHVDPCKLLYVWGHSYEFAMNDNWEVIEKFAEVIGGDEDIWYASNIEIYEYVKAYESLLFSCDMTSVRNMSGMDVWIMCDNGLVKIPSGETVKL